MTLAANEVLQLSPDEASTKAAKGLVVPTKWPRLEFDDAAVWGECQGSGSKPYQVQVDLAGPAFRCSCPSHKFPCKHALALLLLRAQHGERFSQAARPEWVSEWMEARQARVQKQEEKQADAARKEADPAVKARKEAAKRERVGKGLAELQRWLGDRLRQGLAQLPNEPGQWESMATRMVDAQAPGMAYRLRETGAMVGQAGWPARVLGSLGRMGLLIEAFGRLDSLDPAQQADVRAALGFNVEREAVLAAGDQVQDEWLVEGQALDEDERLSARRVWLRGQASGRVALIQDYAFGGRNFEQAWVTGSVLATTLAFFPGSGSARAIVAGPLLQCAPRLSPAQSLQGAMDALSQLSSRNPWLSPLPLRCDDAVPCRLGEIWGVRAGTVALPLRVRSDDGWALLACGGGHPLGVFGEWDGRALRPLSAWGPGLMWQEERVTA